MIIGVFVLFEYNFGKRNKPFSVRSKTYKQTKCYRKVETLVLRSAKIRMNLCAVNFNSIFNERHNVIKWIINVSKESSCISMKIDKVSNDSSFVGTENWVKLLEINRKKTKSFDFMKQSMNEQLSPFVKSIFKTSEPLDGKLFDHFAI